MEESVARIKAILDDALKLKASLEVGNRKINEMSQRQDKVAQVQAEKELELEKREDAVKPIEDVVKFEKAAKEMAEQANKGRISLDLAQQAFQDYKKAELEKLVAQKKIVADLGAEHKRELEALKKAREDVEKERAKIGAEIVANLTKNIPK